MFLAIAVDANNCWVDSPQPSTKTIDVSCHNRSTITGKCSKFDQESLFFCSEASVNFSNAWELADSASQSKFWMSKNSHLTLRELKSKYWINDRNWLVTVISVTSSTNRPKYADWPICASIFSLMILPRIKKASYLDPWDLCWKYLKSCKPSFLFKSNSLKNFVMAISSFANQNVTPKSHNSYLICFFDQSFFFNVERWSSW